MPTRSRDEDPTLPGIPHLYTYKYKPNQLIKAIGISNAKNLSVITFKIGSKGPTDIIFLPIACMKIVIVIQRKTHNNNMIDKGHTYGHLENVVEHQASVYQRDQLWCPKKL